MGIDHTLHIEEPEAMYSGVTSTQILTLSRTDGGLDIIVYFNLNTALSISGSRVSTGLGKTTIKVLTESESGAVCASFSFRKVKLTFDRPGFPTNFIFQTQQIKHGEQDAAGNPLPAE